MALAQRGRQCGDQQLTLTKPKLIGLRAHAIPQELRERPQWVCWKLAHREGQSKPWTKVPHDPKTGRLAKSTDPHTWATFEEARDRFDAGGFDGIGFVFSADDPFAGVDLDNCRNAVTGEIEPWAAKIIGRFRTYGKVSPSGTGVKLFIQAKLPPKGRRKGDIELYDAGRYFAVTGERLETSQTVVRDCQAELGRLHAQIFPQHHGNGRANPPQQLEASDSQIVDLASRARNGEKFSKLWSGATDNYTSHSEADQALCNLLAFYTGPDSQRIDHLFRASGLMRPKWDREDYRTATIGNAIDGCTEFYDWNRRNGEHSSNGQKPTFNRTDYGNAERLVYRHGEIIRFCAPWDKWLVWDGKHWAVDQTGRIVKLAKQTVR
jgi:primase-polymerase (primpol)-like protein